MTNEVKMLSVEAIQDVENTIGYTFKNKVLLEQAFTRSSFANEHKDAVSNEALEFYGDRALDITVTIRLSDIYYFTNKNGNYVARKFADSVEEIDEGFLSMFRSSVVRKETLASRMDELGFAKYLISGSGDPESSSKSVKEDLFEAICGAVAIDCKWDLSTIKEVVSTMLDLDNLIVSAEGADKFVEAFAKWYFEHFKTFARFEYEYDDMFNTYHCTFDVTAPNGESMTFNGSAETRMEARNEAIRQAYDELFTNGERFVLFPDDLNDLFKPTWLKPTLANAVNIVQEMEQHNIIQNVEYEFAQKGNDENGNPQWECAINFTISDERSGAVKCGVASSKTEIKKKAALSLIREIFEAFHIKHEIND